MNREEAIEHAVVSLSSAQGQGAVHAKLMDYGFSRVESEEILQVALKQVHQEQDREKNKKRLICRAVGLALVIMGVGIAIYSFNTARAGGMYVAPAGMIGYGVYMLATGDYGN